MLKSHPPLQVDTGCLPAENGQSCKGHTWNFKIVDHLASRGVTVFMYTSFYMHAAGERWQV